jgi:hypothetical protein
MTTQAEVDTADAVVPPPTPVQEAQQTEPKKAILTEEERLRLENFTLRLMNIQMQEERLIAEVAKCREMGARAKKEGLAFRAELSVKYGMDISKCNITQDGAIIQPQISAAPRG